MKPINASFFRNSGARPRASSPALGYVCALVAMLATIGLVLFVSGWLIIANAGVLYLLVVIASALWLGTGPAVLSLLIAVVAIAYFYAPLDRDLAVTAARLVVITAAMVVGVTIARFARGEQSRAEVERRRFQAVVENAPAGIAVLRGPDFVFELVNPAYQAIVPGKNILGNTVAEAWPELADQVLPLLDGVRRTGEPYHATDALFPVQRSPGAPVSDVYFTFSYIPLHRFGSSVDAILVLVIETTEQVLARQRIEGERERAEELAAEAEELAAEREEHLERLRELDRLKDDFLSTAAHELKTPLTSLLGFAQTLLRQQERLGTPDPQRLSQTLRVIDQQSQKLGRIVNQLLDATHVVGGQLELERKMVDLVGIVQGVVGDARLTTASHTIRVEAPAKLEALVDPLRIEQVVANLVDNAVRYSPEGGMIEVKVAEQDGRAEIVVRDHGIGVPAEKRAHIFERFYRAHQGGQLAGLGIGLYISSQIVGQHGGRITAEYPTDGGTRFLVTIPTGAAKQDAPDRVEG